MKQSRRNFITKATASGVGITLGLNSISTISGMNPVFKASDKIRMGFIGVGNRGSQLMNLFLQNPDCEVAALCDVYEPYVLRDFSKIHPRYVEMGKIPKMGETFSKSYLMIKILMPFVLQLLTIGMPCKQFMPFRPGKMFLLKNHLQQPYWKEGKW